MSLTRAAVEYEIVDRIGSRLSFMGMSTAYDGTNPSLNGPIRRAFVELGYAPVTPLVITDDDLATFLAPDSIEPARDAWRVERLCDMATLQALTSILWKTTDVDWQAGQDSMKASQFVDSVRADVAALEAKIAKPYGPDMASPALGSMTPAPIPNDPFDPWESRTPRGHVYP